MDYSHGVLQSMCSPFFPQLREQLGPFLVDKTKLIEKLVDNGLNGDVDLVLRPRRCGKTTTLLMLNSFFGIPQNDDPHALFRGLYITSNHDLCQEHMGKYAVIFCDFKNITGKSWEEMFSSFRGMVSNLYKEFYEYLGHSLNPGEKEFFESIRLNTASVECWGNSLEQLSRFLARKSGRGVMVFIDEYETPYNYAYEFGFFAKANDFLRRNELSALLKSNANLEYALLAGVTPVTKPGWYSGLNNIETHALHQRNSKFAGMVMFTETEVLQLITLSKCELELEDLKAHYSTVPTSLLVISVYTIPYPSCLPWRNPQSRIFGSRQANSLYHTEVFRGMFLPSISLRGFCLMLMFPLNLRIVSPLTSRH
ncbi:hypothetical protein PILCRDRAFT_820521 [Piloderma croceum F 1598]|uniref:AAA-ATPase-like domain-containing protein n=1 Tax=Piloderma croceum (strain F 1598) TaxID=765440 RepID=A0A0C3BXS6_PILCF|nr:hypothetical protein PILCRDRAFT_820521 [Piloderma croceum F 1598]